jgi:hypothetical protein
MKSKLCVAIALVICATASADETAQAPRATRSLFIAGDISGSAPLLTRPAADDAPQAVFADLAAAKAASIIGTMAMGDTVTVQFFGERTLGNLRTLTLQINKQARPPQVAAVVAELIRGIPRAGIEGQDWTHITRFLTVTDLRCAHGGEVLLLTDGIESTPSFDERSLIAGKTALPSPRPGMLAGCRVTMYAPGVTARGVLPEHQITALIAAWQQWMNAAGASFTGVELQ